jgi:hypothetical protein
MELSFKRILRTYTSEQYTIFCNKIEGSIGSIDVHIKENVIICRVILSENIANNYNISSIKDSICSFLSDLKEESENKIDGNEIVLDIYSAKNLGVFSSETDCVLP